MQKLPVQRYKRVVVPNDENTHKLITTRRYPIYYLAITKCASTYMKNVFYAFDNDELHPDPSRIHDYPKDLERADRTPRWMIRRSPFMFAIVRDPTARFLSMYFDKIYGTGPQNFPQLRAKLAQSLGLDLTPGIDAHAHRQNCHRLIDWIARNLAHETEEPVNPHWRRQTSRIRAVDHMAPTFLPADGLDTALKRMLSPIIPNLDETLAMVRSRNKASYPVPADEVVDSYLSDRVADIYHEDKALYDRTKERHSRRDDKPIPTPSSGAGIMVLTSHRFGVNAIVQPKAGSTYVRNLFYRIDHGVTHPNPVQIDADKCLHYKRKRPATLQNEVTFCIVRDPVERFFSLYFDKVWTEGDSAFPWISEALAKNRRFRTKANLNKAEHHDNCCRLLGFLETRFASEPPEALNPHWRPQITRLKRVQDMGVTALTLKNCTEQLRQIAGRKVRDLDLHLDALTFRNATEKPIAASELASPWIMERLHHLYGEDIALYQRIEAAWAEQGEPPTL